jgi:hypothetical protein
MDEMDRFDSDADHLSDGSSRQPFSDSPAVSSEHMKTIAALADGSLESAERRTEIEADPLTRTALEQQTQAVMLVRDAVSDVRAPAALRERIAALADEEPKTARSRTARPVRSSGRSWGFSFAGLAGAAAAIALVLVLALSGAGGAPTVAQAAALSSRAATLPAPHHDSEGSVLLNRTESGVAFPYWEDRFHVVATGARTDTLGGRHTTTVFYRDRHGRHLAYAIVSGPALKAPPGAEHLTRNGVPMWTTTTANGTTVVTWERAGHSCVLASRDVPASQLQALASWRANGSIPY